MRDGKEKEKALVVWDISSCPIPDGSDPRLVGPKIESALKNSGYSGPIAILAIGDLTQKIPGENVLRVLSSNGIALRHAHDVVNNLDEWTYCNPPPATIMLISASSPLQFLARILYNLEKRGYGILLAYPQRDQALDWLWQSFLRNVCKEWLWKSLLEDEMDSGAEDDNQETTRLVPHKTDESPTPWYCEVCEFVGESFEKLTTHLKSVEHAFSEWDDVASRNNVDRLEVKPPPPPNNDPDTVKVWESLHAADRESRLPKTVVVDAKDEMLPYKEKENKDEMMQYEEERKTLVWWLINSCPIPGGIDPSLVGPRIESALNSSGLSRSGPLTITAIGDLTHIPGGDSVLQQLSSSGIALTHSPHDVQTGLSEWTRCNSTPATIMLISGSSQLECLAPLLYNLGDLAYTTFVAYPKRDPAPGWLWKSFLHDVAKEWLWESLVEGTVHSKQKTTRLAFQDKCSEVGESPWSCSTCRFAGESFKDFSTHLKSPEHASSEKFKKSKTEG